MGEQQRAQRDLGGARTSPYYSEAEQASDAKIIEKSKKEDQANYMKQNKERFKLGEKLEYSHKDKAKPKTGKRTK